MAETTTGLTSSAESSPWQRLDRHLQIGVGFSFVFISIEDDESVAELAQSLNAIFTRNAISLRVLSPPLPDLVYSLPELILGPPVTRMTAATLVVGNGPLGRHGARECESAWRHTVARLNERRDVLRMQLLAPLLFAGPAWLMRLLRDEAPDLWSARALVLRHPPDGQPRAAQSPSKQAADDSLEELIRRTSLVELMDRLREFPQPLSPVTLLGWREREVAVTLHSLQQRRLRPTAEPGDALLEEVLAAAWCVGAHRDWGELSALLSEINLLLDPRRPSGQALSVSARRNFWPQYLALSSWYSALTCNWSDAKQGAQAAISTAELFVNDDDAPLSADALAGVSLAREVDIIASAMTGNERLRERPGRTGPSLSDANSKDDKATSLSARHQLEHGLWMLAHRRFHEAEKYLKTGLDHRFGQPDLTKRTVDLLPVVGATERADLDAGSSGRNNDHGLKTFHQSSASRGFLAGSSEVFVFLKQAIIVCLLAQRRLQEAETEAEHLAACLHPAAIGMRQFVHGHYILFVVYLLCRRKAEAKKHLLSALQLGEQSPAKSDGELQVLRLLLVYAALLDGDLHLFQSTIETMQQSNVNLSTAKQLRWALRGMRYIPGMSAWVSYSFWCAQCADFLERTRDFRGNSGSALETLKLYTYKALGVGWHAGKSSSR